MKQRKSVRAIAIALSVLIFMCSPNTAFGVEKMETVYYYIVQPGDNLWKISEELYGYGGNWESLYRQNQCIFEPSLIYPGMKLEVSGEQYVEEGLLVQERKKINLSWLGEGYVHFNTETPKRQEYPEKTEEEAIQALKEGSLENWLNGLLEPRALSEEEKEDYRKKDSEDILYSYETEKGLPEDCWYLLLGMDGKRWLVVENQERGKSQEFYCFTINSETEKISSCEKIHGAGGRLYLTVEDGILIWITTKETDGEIVGIAGDYRGSLYIGGNFYYELQNDGIVREAYQEYSSIGSGTIREEGATWDYPY